MIKRTIAAAVLAAGSLPGPLAYGAYHTGEEMREACEVKIAFVNGVCEGYVTGIADNADLVYAAGDRERDFCIPQGTADTRLIRVVIDYLEAHKGSLDGNAASYVRTALSGAFPCR